MAAGSHENFSFLDELISLVTMSLSTRFFTPNLEVHELRGGFSRTKPTISLRYIVVPKSGRHKMTDLLLFQVDLQEVQLCQSVAFITDIRESDLSASFRHCDRSGRWTFTNPGSVGP